MAVTEEENRIIDGMPQEFDNEDLSSVDASIYLIMGRVSADLKPRTTVQPFSDIPVSFRDPRVLSLILPVRDFIELFYETTKPIGGTPTLTLPKDSQSIFRICAVYQTSQMLMSMHMHENRHWVVHYKVVKNGSGYVVEEVESFVDPKSYLKANAEFAVTEHCLIQIDQTENSERAMLRGDFVNGQIEWFPLGNPFGRALLGDETVKCMIAQDRVFLSIPGSDHMSEYDIRSGKSPAAPLGFVQGVKHNWLRLMPVIHGSREVIVGVFDLEAGGDKLGAYALQYPGKLGGRMLEALDCDVGPTDMKTYFYVDDAKVEMWQMAWGHENFEQQQIMYDVIDDARHSSAFLRCSKIHWVRPVSDSEADELEHLPKEKRDCIVCCSAEKVYAFLPCMHVALCKSCAGQSRYDRCPLCRKWVTEIKRIYW